jgi:simple sugar transport system permease protein
MIKTFAFKSLRTLAIIAVAFALNTLILLLVGKDIGEVYATMFAGAFIGKWNLARTLRWTTPLLLTGISAAVSFRGGMFNCGIDGQLYFGAFAATCAGFSLSALPAVLLIPTCMLAGILAGGLWGMLAAWISLRFKASEVVITLMLNYVAQLFTEYLVLYPFYSPGIASDSKATASIAPQAQLSPLIPGSQVTTALIISLAVVLIIFVVNTKTVVGFEMKLVGQNPRFSLFSGISIKQRQLSVMALSGGIAGLCGALEILGVHGRFIANFTSGLGFNGIVVALLCENNPLGVLPGALFMGAVQSSSSQLEMVGGIHRSMASILMGMIIMIITVRKMPFFQKLMRRAA